MTAGVSTSTASDGTLNFYTATVDTNGINTNLGKLYSSTGVAAISPTYVGQLYGSTVSNLNSFAPLAVPASFLTGGGAGYINYGTVYVSNLPPGTIYFYALRAWNSAAGSFTNAATNGISGTSQIRQLTLGGTNNETFYPQVQANTFGSFTLQKATSVALVSSLNPSTNGNNVTFTATVSSSSGTPTGNVVFQTNGVPMSTNALSAGVASASTSLLPPGTNTVTAQYVSANDFAGSSKSLDGGFNGQKVIATTYTISGLVELQPFTGTNRMVRFVMSAVSGGTTYLQTNDQTLTFSGGKSPYNLQVPTTTTHLSAKTAWNLRRRLAVTFTNGATTVNFTNTANLRGGDLATGGGTNIVDTDNTVASPDYLLLLNTYLQPVTNAPIGRSDIDGDGAITSVDYLQLLNIYLTTGDPQ